MNSWLEKAQEKGGHSPEDCASALGCSRGTFTNRKERPGTLTLNELHALDSFLTGESFRIAQAAIKEAIPNFFNM